MAYCLDHMRTPLHSTFGLLSMMMNAGGSRRPRRHEVYAVGHSTRRLHNEHWLVAWKRQ